tara:strand:+ start:247 stop:660 length:414 start_codon:yes stop_codon:yes gene_type:complete
MEIINTEYRNNIISNCCSCKIYIDSDTCSGCMEHCDFLLLELTAFHKWILMMAKKHNVTGDENKNIVELLRGEIIKNQNEQVFELMELADIGEQQFDMNTLNRCADILLQSEAENKLLTDKKFTDLQIKKLKKKKTK